MCVKDAALYLRNRDVLIRMFSKGETIYEWRKMLQLCALGTQKMRDDRTNQK